MQHLTSFFILLASTSSFAWAQSVSSVSSAPSSTHLEEAERTTRISSLPPASLPISRHPGKYVLLNGGLSALPNNLTDTELLNRIGLIYDYQSRVIKAVAAEDNHEVEDLLRRSMGELQSLLIYPEVVERPRFQEIYRTVLAEYERYYDVAADTMVLQFGDIFSFRAEIFEAMNRVDEPLLENVSFPPLGPVATIVPMTMNRLVEQSISYLLQSPERHMYNWLSRAETYFPMIEQIFEEEGVPDELKYLAMIESGLNPRARSWASAGGMWQFMAATGSAYGLQVNSWVDERMDPEKATRAAARHLRDLYEQYGRDWHLALAGYNCSPRCVRGAVSRAEARLGRRATFWDVYNDLPRETRNYVPMFIATALVASNPDAFGLDMNNVRPSPEYSYHYVPVHGFLALDDIARMADTDEATLRALNPELRRSQVPPTRDGYYVRIPKGTYDRFAHAYAEMPPSQRQTAVEYVVRRGDTLGRIAAQHGVSVSDLMSTNGLRNTTIRINQRLVVPVPSYDTSPLLASLDGMEILTVNYGRTAIRPIAADGLPRRAQPTAPSATPVVVVNTVAAPSPAGPSANHEEAPAAEEEPAERSQTRVVYTVRRGDNLTDIGRKYGASVADVRAWNNLRSTQIQVGQRLYLYGSDPEPSSTPAAGLEYEVRRGDTLGAIARRHGVSITDVRRWNSLSGDVIRVGQRLTIHTGGVPSTSASYRVQRGDTLTEIARRHGVSVNDLMRWNSLSSSTIRPGQTLRIGS